MVDLKNSSINNNLMNQGDLLQLAAHLSDLVKVLTKWHVKNHYKNDVMKTMKCKCN